MMRIIAGTHKSRTLKTVDKQSTRSTKDRVKETLFNMLGPLHGKAHVLDAFAGVGALGIEALSRGVKHATFIEVDRSAFNVLEENLAALQLCKRAHTQQGNAQAIMTKIPESAYDLIVLDPPYDAKLLETTLALIAKTKCLAPDGVCVTLSSKKATIQAPESLHLYKKRTVGITNLCFYEWSE